MYFKKEVTEPKDLQVTFLFDWRKSVFGSYQLTEIWGLYFLNLVFKSNRGVFQK